MTGTTHALVGAAIGALVRRPGLAFVGGVVSHGILDCVPHKDYTRSTGLVPDALGLLTVLALGMRAGRPEIVAGAIGGLLPDAENLLPCGVLRLPKMFPSHRFRHQDRVSDKAVATEIAVGAAALGFLAAGLALRTWSQRASGAAAQREHAASVESIVVRT